MAFDFSTLPKARAYSYMGGLGDPSGCSIWNPLTYPTCSTWIIQGRTELAEAHNKILDLANLWQATIVDIQQWPESEAKSSALAEAQSQAQSAYELVQQHSQVQNEYETKIQPFASIGLAGLKSGRLKGLGFAIAPWAIYTGAGLAVAALGAWGILSAMALNNSYKASTAYYNQFSDYYRTCQELAKQGKPCSVVGPSTSAPGSNWGSQTVTIALVAGVALMLFLARK